MRKGRLIAGGLASFLLLAAIVFVARFDVNSWKPTIEAAVSRATGMEVTIQGKIALTRWLPLGVVLNDVQFRNRGEAILGIEAVKLSSLGLRALFRERVRASACEVVGPVLTIVKNEDGHYNFERASKRTIVPAEAGSVAPAFLATRLSVRRGSYTYTSQATGGQAAIEGIESDLRDFAISPGGRKLLQAFSFSGSVACKTVRRRTLTMTDVKSPITAAQGRFALGAVTMDLFGGQGTGSFIADASLSPPHYEITLAVPRCRVEQLLDGLGQQKLLGGEATLALHLRAAGRNEQELTQTLSGNVALRGDDLVAYEMDVDQLIAKFERTRRFTLIDLGAFFLAGPLGTVATKGYDFGRVYREAQTGHGNLERLVATWTIRDGVAEADDCAFATLQNRVAFAGKVDLLQQSYQDADVAVLDDQGCSRFSQRLSGPIANRQLVTIQTMQKLAGPFVGLFQGVRRLFTPNAKCEVFYDGSVPQPKAAAGLGHAARR